MFIGESTYFLLLKWDFVHAQKPHTVEKKKGVFVDHCEVIYLQAYFLHISSFIMYFRGFAF